MRAHTPRASLWPAFPPHYTDLARISKVFREYLKAANACPHRPAPSPRPHPTWPRFLLSLPLGLALLSFAFALLGTTALILLTLPALIGSVFLLPAVVTKLLRPKTQGLRRSDSATRLCNKTEPQRSAQKASALQSCSALLQTLKKNPQDGGSNRWAS